MNPREAAELWVLQDPTRTQYIAFQRTRSWGLNINDGTNRVTDVESAAIWETEAEALAFQAEHKLRGFRTVKLTAEQQANWGESF